ncbi:hypothetical protein GDO81_008418 [Engystomops pustulosus]|uniref:Mu-type opioid receptor n=1 Tax=Engystomops pustulosus TaxID=76066 RepID=A0AAV7CGI2_ENGPU|nr:hypothetical protein GDO81_008418 [Engystomops pustulosus]
MISDVNAKLLPTPSPLFRYTKMKTATNIYIFNLALADALATSTLPFQSVNYLMGTWPFGNIVCKIVISIDYYNMFTSIFTLTTMSVDRYIAVCHPVKALDFRTPRNAKIVNVCNWILSSAIGLPVMFMATTKTDRAPDCPPLPSRSPDSLTVFHFGDSHRHRHRSLMPRSRRRRWNRPSNRYPPDQLIVPSYFHILHGTGTTSLKYVSSYLLLLCQS